MATPYLWAPRDKEPGPGSCRSDQCESNEIPGAAIPSPVPPASALAHVLAERDPDVGVVQAALEGLSCENLARIARLSAERDKCIRRESKKSDEHRCENDNRIRVALALESDRAELVQRASTGILRCFGGQQRLAREAAWRRTEGRKGIKDPQLKKIIDRIVEERVRRFRTQEGDGVQPQTLALAALEHHASAPASVDDYDPLIFPPDE